MSSPAPLVDLSGSDNKFPVLPSGTRTSLDAHAGPKSTSHRHMRNPPCPFSGIPSPETMHRHILNKKEDKKYFSITTMPPPAVSWSPLPSHQNMETRTCFHTGSRIHKLDCGHTIAVPRDAEPCASNCKPLMCMISSTESVVPAPYAAAINILRASTMTIVQEHAQHLESAGDSRAEAKLAAHTDVLGAVWNKQDDTLRPQRDLLSGDFSCALCNTTGHRATFPAAVVSQAPYHCVVVGKDEHDVAIIMELGKGAQPQQPRRGLPPFHARSPSLSSSAITSSRFGRKPPLKRLGPANDRGYLRANTLVGGEESFQERKRRLKDGYDSRMRRREKEGVLTKLREDNLLEELDGMEL